MFAKKLEFGRTGESLIAEWMKRRGYNILPVYDKIDNEYKGPAVFLSDGSSVTAPDMLVFGNGKTRWIEAKHKSAFTWHRISQQFVTGIDLPHYRDYLKIMEISEWPVWLMFLQRAGTAKDTPVGKISPTGLFGGDLSQLRENINHTHDGYKRGMVYWSHDSLNKFAELSDLVP